MHEEQGSLDARGNGVCTKTPWAQGDSSSLDALHIKLLSLVNVFSSRQDLLLRQEPDLGIDLDEVFVLTSSFGARRALPAVAKDFEIH